MKNQLNDPKLYVFFKIPSKQAYVVKGIE